MTYQSFSRSLEESLIGQTVSHYRITSQLGAGGMGVVYSAEDTRLGRTVALKLLPPELTRDETAKKRFITEARAASSFQHRNICTIHDIDETPDGRLFLVMDHYEGETLRERIDRGRLPVNEAFDITLQVADGLARAHENGMVHRDIKPANIMITGDGEAKILDFGLAKLAGKTKVTKTGTAVGTTAYMSPEQTRGEEVDASSDVWSVGVMLYEMLAGQRPFTGEHDLAIAYGIVNNSPAPMSTFRGDVPAGVVALIDTCLAKNPKGRFADAAELREAMDHLDEAQQKRRRRPIRGAVLAVIAVAVAAFVVFTNVDRFTGGEAEAQEHALAIVDFRDIRATPDETTAPSITSLLNVAMVQNSPMRVVSPSYLQDLRRRMFEDTDGPIDPSQALELARRAGATLMLTGDVSDADGTRMVMWQLIDTRDGHSLGADRSNEQSVLSCADAIVEATVPHVAEVLGIEVTTPVTAVEGITTESDLAFEHYTRGVTALATHETTDAIRQLKRALDVDSTFAMAHLALTEAYVGELSGYADLVAARRHVEAAWRHRDNLNLKQRLLLEARRLALNQSPFAAMDVYDEIVDRWPDDRDVLVTYTGRLHYTHYYQRALDLARRGTRLYPGDARLATTCFSAARGLGRPAEALPELRSAIAADPGNVNLWDSFAEMFLFAGEPDSAEVYYRRALDVDPGFIYSKRGLADVAYARGDLEGALRLFEAVASEAEANAPEDTSRVISAVAGYLRLGLTGCLAEMGRCRESLGRVTALGPYAVYNEGWRKYIGYRVCLLLTQMGRYDDVVDYVNRASIGDSYRLAEFQWFAGVVLARSGDTEAARAVLAVMKPHADAGYPKIRMMSLMLEAHISLAEGNPALAVAKIDTMTAMGGRTILKEETNTLVATAYHRNGQSDEAIKVLKDFLRIWKGHALGHYELAKIYQDLDRHDEARSELETFLEMWRNADEDMPQLIDARERLAQLKAAGT